MKYFGTDGFRGRANDSLRVEHALKIGQFLGWYYGARIGQKARCVIGKDTRRSSYMFEYGLSAGLTSAGAEVNLLHVTTTPSVSYIVKSEKFDFGIMITASHNPYHDNGIKVINRDGYKMEEEVLAQIEEYIDGKLTIPFSSDNVGRCTDYFQGRNKYISYLASVPLHSLRGYRIGLDCANGSAFNIAKTVFDMLGAETYVISNTPNGTNINVECGSTHIEALQKLVRGNQLDAGFAFDGDADRCFCVDENGNVVDGDAIMYIGACYLKERGGLVDDTVVVTVMSNLGLFNALKEKGIKTVITPVGDKYISQEIKDHGYSIGGEQSGHVIFDKYATTGDGILTAIIMADILVEKKCVFSHLARDLKILPQKLKNLSVPDKDAVMNNPAVVEFAEKLNEKLDGSGRLLLRKSGTEPVVRIMVEAATLEECDRYIAETEKFILENGV
ncbi:MAG: phosphoglucosamine mutase [Lachnospiraceae bacterium]|nr:phosphoglucosamine mutase [Lachnospiraceae bacterium]